MHDVSLALSGFKITCLYDCLVKLPVGLFLITHKARTLTRKDNGKVLLEFCR